MLETLRVALTSIRGNLFRAALTMLGVIIGVAAVITMLALGTGAQRAVEEQLEALGANVITVTTGMRFAQGVAREQQVLTTDDAEAVRDDARNVAAVSPEQSSRQQVKLGNRNLNLSVIGTAPQHPEVNGYTLRAGRMFTAIDDASHRRVAVLGGEVPELLQTTADALLCIGKIAIAAADYDTTGTACDMAFVYGCGGANTSSYVFFEALAGQSLYFRLVPSLTPDYAAAGDLTLDLFIMLM